MGTAADPLRRRLEDRAAVLEVGLVRARALRGLLSGLWWRAKLRRNAGLLHQMAESEPELEAILAATLRRADAEGWSAEEPVLRGISELTALRTRITALAATRLKLPAPGLALPDLLVRLDALVAGPRKILPGQKWSVALEVLPSSLPELERARVATVRLAELFSRPPPPQGLGLSVEEVEALRRLLPEAEASLEALWGRIRQVDPTLGLLRFLQRRARRAPTHPPRNGPEALLRAAFWHDVAWTRLRQLAGAHFSPVELADAELLDALAWAAHPPGLGRSRLVEVSALAPARAALLELASELGSAQPRRAGAGGVGAAAPGDRLVRLAVEAEAAGESEDLVRVRETVGLFLRIRDRETAAARAEQPRSLRELMERVAAPAAAAPVRASRPRG